jgi:hypothetical protein
MSSQYGLWVALRLTEREVHAVERPSFVFTRARLQDKAIRGWPKVDGGPEAVDFQCCEVGRV